MKYRGRTEIVRTILKSLSEERKTRTYIMYTAYLSFSQAKTYTEYCLEKHLIEQDGVYYHLTNHGLDTLRKLEGIEVIGL